MPASSAAIGRLQSVEAIGFAALAVCYVLPIWAFPYVPTQDGPCHLASAVLLRDLLTDATGTEFFALRSEAIPNWTAHLLLAGLTTFVAPTSAEKILWSLYVVGLAYSIRRFL